ncbi:hypothetical protein [Halosegnis longus]|uniref:hypothetical protein n=1 Tax=Halosegnis longus TaxID=2216012 RepID=UPI00129EF12A|nr:hypothetical protein [Halosegnis longus]
MVTDRTVELFDGPLPAGDIIVEGEEHVYTDYTDIDGNADPVLTYQLGKAPVLRVTKVIANLNGVKRTLTRGDEWEVVDDNGDGRPDSIRLIDPEDFLTTGTTLSVTYVSKSIVSRITDASDSQIDRFLDLADEIIDSRQIDHADGRNLDRQGEMFGQIGGRGGRNDSEYRTLLRTIVELFNGRGTRSGMKRAVAIALDISTDDVTVIEDFEQNGFTVSISNVDTGVQTTVLNDLIQLAKPSGISVLEPPVLELGGTISVSADGFTVVDETAGLGTGTLGDGSLE